MTIDKTFYLLHCTGAKLYPYLVRKRSTGTIAFRVSAPGKRDAHDLAEENTDVAVVMEKVYRHGYSVRAKTEDGSRDASYRMAGRSIIGASPEP